MSVSLIAAVASNGAIGFKGAIPWHIPRDLQHFKEITTGHAVIMGRRTWESIPPKFRPLAGRQNIVVSRNANYVAPGATVTDSFHGALGLAVIGRSGHAAETFVIGGAQLYKAAMPSASKLYLTEIGSGFHADTWFPTLTPDWEETSRSETYFEAGLAYTFVTYQRQAL